MPVSAVPLFRDQLLDRRHKLEDAIARTDDGADLTRLLDDVDAALERIAGGTFGVCEACGEAIETDRLIADPLVRVCLDHLTATARRALEQDLELASRVQHALLPRNDTQVDGWEIAYFYRPAGTVSGDYCDLIPNEGGDVHFLVGDVSGKGVAAAMLMSSLSATFRTLISTGWPLSRLMERASRMFCESTVSTQYATLICGRASATGDVEICNAGHPPALLIRREGVRRLGATGLPIGMFCSEQFTSEAARLDPGDTLLLYTDGVTEAQDANGLEYGMDRLDAIAASASLLSPRMLIDACVHDLTAFAGPRTRDDVTIMAVRRA